MENQHSELASAAWSFIRHCWSLSSFSWKSSLECTQYSNIAALNCIENLFRSTSLFTFDTFVNLSHVFYSSHLTCANGSCSAVCNCVVALASWIAPAAKSHNKWSDDLAESATKLAGAMAGAMSFLGILNCRLQLRVPLLSLVKLRHCETWRFRQGSNGLQCALLIASSCSTSLAFISSTEEFAALTHATSKKILWSGKKPEKGFRMARWPSCPLRLQTLLKFCRLFLRFFLCRPLQSKAACVIKEWSKWADHVRSCAFHCLSSEAWCPAEASCNKAVVWQRAPLSNWLCCKKDYLPLAHPSATYLWICSGWTCMRQGLAVLEKWLVPLWKITLIGGQKCHEVDIRETKTLASSRSLAEMTCKCREGRSRLFNISIFSDII